MDIVYKVSEGDSLMLDAFLPRNTQAQNPFPVVIIIHGGAWVEGERTLETIDFMRKLRAGLIGKGIAVVSIDYTLLNKTKHLPLPIADCKDAVRWVKAHAAVYNLDTANIGLWGGSAGGHLALLTAYTNDSLWTGAPELAPWSSKVNYVIDYFGPTALNKLLRTEVNGLSLFIARVVLGKKLLAVRERLIFALTGYQIDADKEKVIETLRPYSPLQYLSTAIPTFIFHGTKDNVVPLEQSRELHRRLVAGGVPTELIIVHKGDHGFNNISETRKDLLVEKTVQFVQSQKLPEVLPEK